MSIRTNEQWLADLGSPGPQRESALADLHEILVSGLRRGLLNRVNTSAPEFETMTEDFVQEALLKILDNLDTFAGRSLFTTWAHKIAVSVALTELRRKRWQDQSLEGIMETETGIYTPGFIADPAPQPENAAERAEMLARVQQLINEGLTEKQRTALVESVINGHSTAAVAAKMNMKPNAVYKLLHDARLRLKRHLANEGLTPADVIAVFE
ncbi:MAG TPA: sigma-70 family RNA polymerase sigma factor [Anaerolineae bacterium]